MTTEEDKVIPRHQALARLALAVVLAYACSTLARDLPTTKPENVGLSAERLNRIAETFNAKVREGEIPGYVALVA